MTYRSTPSFAVGGVAWLDHTDDFSSIYDIPPCGWRCFHCNEHFTDPKKALIHFGDPGSKKEPECLN